MRNPSVGSLDTEPETGILVHVVFVGVLWGEGAWEKQDRKG